MSQDLKDIQTQLQPLLNHPDEAVRAAAQSLDIVRLDIEAKQKTLKLEMARIRRNENLNLQQINEKVGDIVEVLLKSNMESIAQDLVKITDNLNKSLT